MLIYLKTFLLGVIEHWNGCGGRTYENEVLDNAYAHGMNLADRLRNRPLPWK